MYVLPPMLDSSVRPRELQLLTLTRIRIPSWGESAGAISVAAHMLHNDGRTDGLFRAAFMQSGAPIPTGDVDDALCQSTFDQIVARAGCTGNEDAVGCLRNVSVDVFSQALEDTAAQSTYFVRLSRDVIAPV